MVRMCLIQPAPVGVTETFIASHIARLSGVVGVICLGGPEPTLNGRSLIKGSLFSRGLRHARRRLLGESWEFAVYRGIARGLKSLRADVALAEYGTTGVMVWKPCVQQGVPLVVHFHGYDASKNEVIQRLAIPYQQMFEHAAAVIGVSAAMCEQLIRLGCPQSKLIYSPYGVDIDQFTGRGAARSEAKFVAVGRFVEKKAPYLTIVAFAKVAKHRQDASLVFIGDGPLLPMCKDLAGALGVDSRIRFLGSQAHDVVAREMADSCAFVQHSITASSGDSEGTPLAVLEAAASGLPVVATRHAGIMDVVVHERTGFLVDERDVAGMAKYMGAVLDCPMLAREMGAAGRLRVEDRFTMGGSISRLESILAAAAGGRPFASLGMS